MQNLETCELCGKDFPTEHDETKVVYICDGCECKNKDANGNACYNCEGGFGNCEKDEESHMQKITRQQFMDYFRSDAYSEELSADDCKEIFLESLKGSSDITHELVEELEENYGVDIAKVKGQEFIDMLDLQIGIESDRKIDDNWTADYKEGYIDGIKRWRELFLD